MVHENKDVEQETVELKGSIKDKKVQEQFSKSLRRAMKK